MAPRSTSRGSSRQGGGSGSGSGAAGATQRPSATAASEASPHAAGHEALSSFLADYVAALDAAGDSAAAAASRAAATAEAALRHIALMGAFGAFVRQAGPAFWDSWVPPPGLAERLAAHACRVPTASFTVGAAEVLASLSEAVGFSSQLLTERAADSLAAALTAVGTDAAAAFRGGGAAADAHAFDLAARLSWLALAFGWLFTRPNPPRPPAVAARRAALAARVLAARGPRAAIMMGLERFERWQAARLSDDGSRAPSFNAVFGTAADVIRQAPRGDAPRLLPGAASIVASRLASILEAERGGAGGGGAHAAPRPPPPLDRVWLPFGGDSAMGLAEHVAREDGGPAALLSSANGAAVVVAALRRAAAGASGSEEWAARSRQPGVGNEEWAARALLVFNALRECNPHVALFEAPDGGPAGAARRLVATLAWAARGAAAGRYTPWGLVATTYAAVAIGELTAVETGWHASQPVCAGAGGRGPGVGESSGGGGGGADGPPSTPSVVLTPGSAAAFAASLRAVASHRARAGGEAGAVPAGEEATQSLGVATYLAEAASSIHAFAQAAGSAAAQGWVAALAGLGAVESLAAVLASAGDDRRARDSIAGAIRDCRGAAAAGAPVAASPRGRPSGTSGQRRRQQTDDQQQQQQTDDRRRQQQQQQQQQESQQTDHHQQQQQQQQQTDREQQSTDQQQQQQQHQQTDNHQQQDQQQQQPPQPNELVCATCGRTAAQAGVPKLLACGGCRSVRYCPDGDCAAAGWSSGHREQCAELRQQRKQRRKAAAATAEGP
jgi:hypothetical protein